jgi:hypothetical protein
MPTKIRFLTAFIVAAFCAVTAHSAANARMINVLLVTGDWKSQAWYQDVVMGGKQLYRGRFIEQKVNEAAPNKFHFTEMTNYVAQEYIDANYLSQFDVVLFGDLMGVSVPDHVWKDLHQYIRQGGGFVYCASYKWHTCLGKHCHLDSDLPVSLTPPGSSGEDWTRWPYLLPESNFRAVPTSPQHPILQGLDWASAPKLDRIFSISPKPGSDVLLNSSGGAPLLVAGHLGQGRTVASASIFANDEVSTEFCQNWNQIGRFYAQLFTWLAAHSTNKQMQTSAATGTASIVVNANEHVAAVLPGLFSFNSAVFPPNIGPLKGIALQNFEATSPQGEFSRISPQGFEPQRGRFDFKRVDEAMLEFERLHLRPEVVFDDILNLGWIWNGGSWTHPTKKQIADCCDYVSDFLVHTNRGTGKDASYKPTVAYLEIGNEPPLSSDSIDGFTQLYCAVADRVHANFPGVSVGALGNNEVPYVDWFVDRAKGKVDFISRHPYGYTADALFKLQDEFQSSAKQKGYPPLRFLITEWDFWISGPAKFDYMMKRTFASLKRGDLIGALHYRLDQYPEPTYMFGALWGNLGLGVGRVGTPMHDAYDAYWIFNHLRGIRVNNGIAAKDPNLAKHLYAESSIESPDKLSTVVYYDYGYDGTGYLDLTKGLQYKRVDVDLTIKLPASKAARKINLASADGTAIKAPQTVGEIAPGQTQASIKLSIEPHTAIRVDVSP